MRGSSELDEAFRNKRDTMAKQIQSCNAQRLREKQEEAEREAANQRNLNEEIELVGRQASLYAQGIQGKESEKSDISDNSTDQILANLETSLNNQVEVVDKAAKGLIDPGGNALDGGEDPDVRIADSPDGSEKVRPNNINLQAEPPKDGVVKGKNLTEVAQSTCHLKYDRSGKRCLIRKIL